MIREALSSLFLVCSFFGKWLSKVVAAVFTVCMRNQRNESWFSRPISIARSDSQGQGIKDTPIAIKEVNRPQRTDRDGGWRGGGTRCCNKRSVQRAFPSPENPTARPFKRRKQGPKAIWRF
ncbi:unnamed protein product [Linum trigynum]|uniref:Secreted protein n=1 Tax=Linum trigynum TaxID=586398 RepID=A0AAV2D677_9ROSI